MHSIKKIVISFSFVVQGLISGAQICPSIPKEITLVCDNEEKIERVPVALLMNNFGFFTSYFERWDRFSDTINQGELRIHASADAMGHLLVSVRNYSEGVGAFPEEVFEEFAQIACTQLYEYLQGSLAQSELLQL